MARYSENKKVGDRKFMQLKEINLNFFTTEDKVYHNDWEVNHHFKGYVAVEVSDYNTNDFYPFGQKTWLPQSANTKVPIERLPKELQEELKAVWLKVENALVQEDK